MPCGTPPSGSSGTRSTPRTPTRSTPPRRSSTSRASNPEAPMDTPPEADTLATLQKAYSTGDLALALSVMADDVVWDISGPAEVPYAGVFYGKEGFGRFWWLLGQTVTIHQA